MADTFVTVGGAIVNLVVANPPIPSVATDPVISGTTAYSGNLTVSTPAAFAGPVTDFGYVWQYDNSDTLQTGTTYVKTASDAGRNIRVKAYANGPGGSFFAYSDYITINGALSIGTTGFPEGQAGTSYNYTIPASGGVEPYIFACSALPAGLSLNTGTGVVSGTPSALGSTSYTLSVTDADGAVSSVAGTFTISTTPVGDITDLAQVSITTNSVVVSFTDATNATSHQYRLNGGSWTTLASDKIITGLSVNTSYTVEVRGISDYAQGSDSNDLSIHTLSGGSETVGLGYTPAYVPSFTLYATRALLLTALGLTTGDVITASDYANFETALEAANSANKPLVVGTDNGQYTKTTTQSRVYWDVDIYAYGTSSPRITGATRLEGWLCSKRRDVRCYGIQFKDFTQVHMYAVGTLPLARPDKSGYNASTTPAARSPYHSGNDKLNIATASAIDAGYNMQCVGHIDVSGSPNISSIKPVRFQKDGGPSGTRVPYNYTPSGQTYQLYAPSNPNGVTNLLAAMDASAPNLLASTVSSANNASLVVAINANTATSGYGAQLDPRTGKVVVYVVPKWYGTATISSGSTLTLNSTVGGSAPSAGDTVMIQSGSTNTACVIASGSGPYTLVGTTNTNISGTASTAVSRPLDWTVTKTGGTVTYDAVGAAMDMSYCTFSGCDRVGGGIGDSTAVGTVNFHKNVGRATWAGLSFPVLQWTNFYAANNDFQDCLLSGGTYGTVSGRTAGNAQNRGANQDGTMWWFGANNQCLMYYIQSRGGTVIRCDHNYFKDIEGNINVDTVNSATILDVRNVWDTSANRRDNHTFNYNYIENVKNVVGAIDANIFYLKGDSFTCTYNELRGFGAKRVSGYRPNVGAGSECGGFLHKNNGYDFDPLGEWYVAYNYMTDGPNGIPWIKGEDSGGIATIENNHIYRWDSRLDDATVGNAIGRTDPATNGTCTVATTGAGTSSNPYVVTMTATVANGTLRPGMAVVIGSNVRYVLSGSGSTWLLNHETALTVSSSTAFSADWHNRVDGALIRWYSRIKGISIRRNFFENINDQGDVPFLMHSITNMTGGSYATWNFDNNVAKNDNSSAFPQHTAQKDWFYLDNSPSNMGNVSSMDIGYNSVQNAAGTQVASLSFKKGSTTYTSSGSPVSDPYTAIP